MQPRQLVVISDTEEKALARAGILIREFPEDRVISADKSINSVLGKEYLAVIYNCYQGFNPDMLGATGGTLVAGGVLILVTPLLEDWPGFTDPFNERIANWPYQASDLSGYYIERFVNKLKQADFITIVRPDNELPTIKPPNKVAVCSDEGNTDYASALADQSTALSAISNAFLNEPSNSNSDQPCPTPPPYPHPPIVLEADRGRGKSAVLGMVAKRFENSNKTILVTAPSRKTADVIFRHAGDQAPLSFIAPDLLCRELPKADVLFVDEAAAIPASLLVQMLRHYPQIVFSTTVHGYEGTGRGFALRFRQQLDTLTPHWKHITLKQPIRYVENDPLECFLFESLLLDAKPVHDQALKAFNQTTCPLKACVFQTISSAEIINDEALLREVFGLLVLAHYQTRPTDLRHLLDGKNISICIIKWQEHVVATALCVEEGGFDAELAHEIHYGTRRPRGHLVPQSLAFHAGIADAPLYTTTRIMRIVVHPVLQRQGIASLLLSKIEKNSPADYLSTSFGATQGLLEFWGKQGFRTARIGFNRDASSGSHSVILLKALSQQGIALCEKSIKQFQRYLPLLLTEPLRDLEEEVIEAVSGKGINQKSPKLEKNKTPLQISKQDLHDIHSFAFGNRGYECCMLALHKLVTTYMENESCQSEQGSKLNNTQQSMLKDKVINHHPWHQIISAYSLRGKKQALKEIRQMIATLQT